MDQEIEIISSETRKEKIKNFFINNKNKLISIVVFLLLVLFGFFFYQDYKKGHKEGLANNCYVINQDEIESMFETDYYLKYIDQIFERLDFN